MRTIIYNLFLILVLYIYIYRPEFISYPGLLTNIIVCITVAGLFLKWRYISKYVYLFRFELLICILLFVFSFFRFLFGGEIYRMNISVHIILELMLMTLLIVSFIQIKLLIKIVFFVSVIASVISFCSFIFPQFKEILFSLFTYDEKLLVYTWRGYGLSSDLLFTFSVAQSVILCFLFETKKRMLILLCLVPFLVAIFFNARVGIIPVSLYLVYKIIIEKKISVLLYLAVTIFLVVQFILYSGLYDEYEATFSWLIDAFADITNSILGTSFNIDTSNIDILQNMFVYPSTVQEWIFGKGYSIFGRNRLNSDIGYIIQLNYGGIVYCLLLLSFFVRIVLRLVKSSQFSWYSFVMPFSFLLLNYKGDIFQPSSFMRLFMLSYVIIIIRYEKNSGDISIHS